MPFLLSNLPCPSTLAVVAVHRRPPAVRLWWLIPGGARTPDGARVHVVRRIRAAPVPRPGSRVHRGVLESPISGTLSPYRTVITHVLDRANASVRRARVRNSRPNAAVAPGHMAYAARDVLALGPSAG